MAKQKRIAVLLCGSGYKDGSEIRESVATLWALSSFGASVQCFAPDLAQREVVNCLTQETAVGQTRNMRVEAARIARGEVLALEDYRPEEYDGLIIPGGFGVAKNLCDFALKGANGAVLPLVKDKLQETYQAARPIGAICIAPALVALAFPKYGFELTVGESGEVAQEIEKLGHTTVECSADACVVDPRHRIATTPAYMVEAPLAAIFEGIRQLTESVLKLRD